MLLVWLVVVIGYVYLVFLYWIDWFICGLVMFLVCFDMCDVY